METLREYLYGEERSYCACMNHLPLLTEQNLLRLEREMSSEQGASIHSYIKSVLAQERRQANEPALAPGNSAEHQPNGHGHGHGHGQEAHEPNSNVQEISQDNIEGTGTNGESLANGTAPMAYTNHMDPSSSASMPSTLERFICINAVNELCEYGQTRLRELGIKPGDESQLEWRVAMAKEHLERTERNRMDRKN